MSRARDIANLQSSKITADSGIDIDNITLEDNTISTTNSNGNLTVAPNGTGDIYLSTDKTIVLAGEGESATLMLVSDESDDNGDDWSFIANTDNTLTIGNDASGSNVAHVTITPNATVANSTANFAGKVGVGGTPDQKMHIYTSAGTTLYKAEVNANSTVGLEIKKTGSTTQTWRIVDGETVNGALQFYDVTDSRVSMQIDGSGNTTFAGGITAAHHVNIGTGMSFQWGDSHERIEQSDGNIEFFTGNGEKMRLHGSTLVIGKDSADTTLSGGTPPFQVIGTGSKASIAAVRREANAYGSSLILAKSRNTTVGSYTALADNDALGYILFIGDDGTDLDTYGATIHAEVNGTPGSNDMPADLVFSINSGSASATERMRLTFNQYDASELEVTSANSSNNNANAWVRTRSKGYYWNGISLESYNSSSGNIDGIGSIMGKYQSGSPEIKFFIGGTGPATGADAIIIDGSANVNVITGNVKISTSGKGIDFSATGDGSGTDTSELLADYEEGTWTPGTSTSGTISGTSITYSGTYTKIGNTVHVWFQANNSAGDIQISSYKGFDGLPYASTTVSKGTGTVITEDFEVDARQGFVTVSASTFWIGSCGSSSGTNQITAQATYRVN